MAPRISIDENVRFGKPVIEGTRVLVVGTLANGMTPEQVAEECGLTGDDVLPALSYAATVLSEMQIGRRRTGP